MSNVRRWLDPAVLEATAPLQLLARRISQGGATGLHRSPFKGASLDFRQHRFYTPGDEPRRIDWRVLARSDRPFVKEYEEETNLRALLLLDASGSMDYGAQTPTGSKFVLAARLAASLAYLMLSQGESVGLATFGGAPGHYLAPSSHRAQLAHLVQILDRTAPTGEAQTDLALHAAADRLRRRCLIVLLSDCFAPVEALSAGLRRAAHGRHDLIILRILHPDELQFGFTAPMQLHDLENSGSLLIEPAMMRARYLSNFQAHAEQLRRACDAIGAQLATFETDVPLVESLPRFLQQRAKVVHRK